VSFHLKAVVIGMSILGPFALSVVFVPKLTIYFLEAVAFCFFAYLVGLLVLELLDNER
jgi:hypothetical protein